MECLPLSEAIDILKIFGEVQHIKADIDANEKRKQLLHMFDETGFDIALSFDDSSCICQAVAKRYRLRLKIGAKRFISLKKHCKSTGHDSMYKQDDSIITIGLAVDGAWFDAKAERVMKT